MNDHFMNAGRAAADGTDYPNSVLPCEVDRELVALAEKAAAAIAASTPTPDAILGDYVGLSGLIRSVSVHEGRMLEEGLALIARWNPDLVVLTQGLRLPVTPAALEALANNRSGLLARLSFDADARTRASYTPDLVLVNRSHRTATIIDMKRSVASYLDTHRLAELKTRMLAASLILPDWLYKEQKRLDGRGGRDRHHRRGERAERPRRGDLGSVGDRRPPGDPRRGGGDDGDAPDAPRQGAVAARGGGPAGARPRPEPPIERCPLVGEAAERRAFPQWRRSGGCRESRRRPRPWRLPSAAATRASSEADAMPAGARMIRVGFARSRLDA